MSESIGTNVQDFLGALGAGVLEKKLALLLSQAAHGTVLHGRGSKTGKVTIEFTLKQVGENSQVIVSHKLSHKTPTARGNKTEEDVSETPMYVGKNGVMTETAPREEFDGQFSLVRSSN